MSVILGLGSVAPVQAGETLKKVREPSTLTPDLGTVRYRDPEGAREIWLGLEGGGVYVPESISPVESPVWLAQGSVGWAFALLPAMALGGRHGISLYEAMESRLRVHTHELELSGRPGWRRLPRKHKDRLALGVETHRLLNTQVKSQGEWKDFAIGGVNDIVLRAGYGMEHRLHPKWWVAWRMQARYAWVFQDTQRMLHAALRLSWSPRAGHALLLEGQSFLVHRDASQFGMTGFARTSLHGQMAGEYRWMGTQSVGVSFRAQIYSGFLNGETPLYEVRIESLQTPFAQASVGVFSAF